MLHQEKTTSFAGRFFWAVCRIPEPRCNATEVAKQGRAEASIGHAATEKDAVHQPPLTLLSSSPDK